MSDTCPRCGSSNVAIGSFVLSCSDCDWSYLNKHPCSTCGKPSYSCVGSSNLQFYGCREHPITTEQRDACWRALFKRYKLATTVREEDFQ